MESPGALWPHLPLTLLWLPGLSAFVAPGNLRSISVYLEGGRRFFMSTLPQWWDIFLAHFELEVSREPRCIFIHPDASRQVSAIL